MTGDRREAAHAVRPEPLPQRIDQERATFRAIAAGIVGDQLVLPRRHSFGAAERKPDRLEAETCIFRRRQRLELQIDQPHDVRQHGGLGGERNVDRFHAAVDAVERKPQAARAERSRTDRPATSVCMWRRASATIASWVKIGSSR